MPKITSSNTKPLFIKYAVRIVVSTVLSLFLFSAISSFAVLKLDISIDILPYVAAGISILSAILISSISTSGFKNNYLTLSLISILPLLALSIINFCFHRTSSFVIIIKIAGILISAVIVALIKSGKKSR